MSFEKMSFEKIVLEKNCALRESRFERGGLQAVCIGQKRGAPRVFAGDSNGSFSNGSPSR